ncbi:MAG TPA: hypothetical protein VNI55_10030 [Gaiellaceae bacterium]|nr:hypothetical protein [Gaiellaceae bacterium]
MHVEVEFEPMKVRIAENESMFRSANERIAVEAEALGFVSDPVSFVCECPDPSCTEIVELTLSEYEDVRTGPTRFFTTPGHQALAVQAGAAVVVEERDDMVIAEKIGVAGEVAAANHGKDLVL